MRGTACIQCVVRETEDNVSCEPRERERDEREREEREREREREERERERERARERERERDEREREREREGERERERGERERGEREREERGERERGERERERERCSCQFGLLHTINSKRKESLSCGVEPHRYCTRHVNAVISIYTLAHTRPRITNALLSEGDEAKTAVLVRKENEIIT